VVYAHIVKRLQILIDADLDAALEEAAQRQRRSKGALVRESLRKELKPLPPIEQDPIWELAGRFSMGPNSSQEVDDVVYGLRRAPRAASRRHK